MRAEERIAHLETEIAHLREQLMVALAHVQDLEARIAKDSHNSSKPPSSDGLKRPLPLNRPPSLSSSARSPHIHPWPILPRLGDMWLGDGVGSGEVGDRARKFEDTNEFGITRF